MTCGCVIVQRLICLLVFLWTIQILELFLDQTEKSYQILFGILGIGNLRITNCVCVMPFILAINLDVVSSSNVFSILVFEFKCNVLLF